MTAARENRIRREASEWVVKFDGVDFHAGDVRAFRRWLSKSDDHRAAFAAASRTWNQLDLLSKLEAFPLPANDAVAVDRRALLVGGAAGAISIGVAGYVVMGAGPAEAYETGVGEVREVRLSDGTSVVLNAATRIEARVAREERSVRVIRGEALFTIAERANQTFSISTTSGGVDAASGQVLVKVLADGARVSLMSGSARAWRAGLLSENGSINAESGSEVELGRGDVHVSRVDAPVLSRRMLWRDGRLAFDDTPLSEAVDDVSRHTGARFAFADPALRDLRIGGLIDARDLDAFLLMLRENLAIDAERGSDGAIMLSSNATLAP
jgi:transmembrane sensor